MSISPDSPATPGDSSSQTTPTEERDPDSQISQPSQSNFVVECQKSDLPCSVDPKFHKPVGDKVQGQPTDAGTSKLPHPAKIGVHDAKNLTDSKPAPLSQLPTFQRFKSSPEFKVTCKETTNDNIGTEKSAKEEEEITSSEVANMQTNIDPSDPLKRERIEQYKRERRSFLREKYKSESFRGEKDDMILRLRQKATSPSRPGEEGAEDDELVMYSGYSSSITQKRRESLSPTKQLIDISTGKLSPTKQTAKMGNKERFMESNASKDKREDQEEVSVFKRTSPSRRSLSDMGKAGELKSPTRTRFSSGGPAPSFRRNSSSGSNSSSGKPSEPVIQQPSTRQLPEKESTLQRSSSGESKSSPPPRKNSSSSSPVTMPDALPLQKPGTTQGRRNKLAKNDVEDDVNVKARVATWGRTQDKPSLKDTSSVSKEEPETKTEKAASKKQEEKPGKEMLTKKNSSPTPLSPVRKSSLPKATPPSPGIPKAPSSSPGSGKVSSPGVPKAPPQSPTRVSTKPSNKQKEETIDAVSAANANARGNPGQQSRIRDMAAIFERDSPTGSKPAMVRQSSREEKKER